MFVLSQMCLSVHILLSTVPICVGRNKMSTDGTDMERCALFPVYWIALGDAFHFSVTAFPRDST